MKNKILLTASVCASLLLVSCEKYLDVSPKSSLSESQLFNSEVGFQQALTGVYSQLATRDIYGDNLTMGFASALAQNYGVARGYPLADTKDLNYASAEVVEKTTRLWSTSYTAIAGLNKVIQNTETNRSILSEQSYAQIRGEALGLRALLHFDLFRIFGPEYVANENSKAIPYKKTVDQYANVPSTAKVVVELALADLKEAAELLKGYESFTATSYGRRSRMNYYAVKALEARIRLYANDKEGARTAALEITESGKFPFITTAELNTGNAATKDRLFLKEQILMIRVRNIADWADPGYFRFDGNATFRLTRTAAEFSTLFETASGGTTDFRYVYGVEQDQGFPFPSKYWQTYSTTGNSLDSARLDQYVPVIRSSEMYYILAETAATPAQGVGYLNTVRRNRGLAELPLTVTQQTLESEITKEYQKEFYAEGQVFFYYKRKNIVRMQFRTVDVPLSTFVLPIPSVELEFNPTY